MNQGFFQQMQNYTNQNEMRQQVYAQSYFPVTAGYPAHTSNQGQNMMLAQQYNAQMLQRQQNQYAQRYQANMSSRPYQNPLTTAAPMVPTFYANQQA